MGKRKKIAFKKALEYVISDLKENTNIDIKILSMLYISLIGVTKPNKADLKEFGVDYWEHVLDLFCYAYYVKLNPFVTDGYFNKLETYYCKKYNKEYAPMRGMEGRLDYTNGVKFIYDYIS